jgi:hypothetical protein
MNNDERKYSSRPIDNKIYDIRVSQVTPRLKGYLARNTTHYLFPEYFQRLRAKK